MTTIDPRHVEILAGAIREAMRKGKQPSVREVTDVPGGTIEIDGEFDLSTLAHACLAEIERAGFKLVKA